MGHAPLREGCVVARDRDGVNSPMLPVVGHWIPREVNDLQSLASIALIVKPFDVPNDGRMFGTLIVQRRLIGQWSIVSGPIVELEVLVERQLNELTICTISLVELVLHAAIQLRKAQNAFGLRLPMWRRQICSLVRAFRHVDVEGKLVGWPYDDIIYTSHVVVVNE